MKTPLPSPAAPAQMARALALFLARRACLGAVLVALSALAFAGQPAQAAVTEAWVHRYSNVVSNSNDQAVKVVVDAAGDIIVTGTTDDRIHGPDMLTIKYSGADGSVLWQQRYNGPANGFDYANAVAVDGSGNVVVTGVSYTGDSQRGYFGDYYTAKYAAADGTLLWEKRYNGPANYNDEARAMAVDGTGNVVVTGTSSDDYYTAKYAAADGALLWEKRYNGPANGFDYANAVAVDGSGNVVVSGSSATVKYAAADGALLWEKNNYYYYYAQALAVDSSGSVVVTGSSNGGVGSTDYYTAKYAAVDGALLWENRYNGLSKSYNEARAVVVDGGGNVVVTGYSEGNRGGGDYYTAKYAAADGALLWEQRSNGLENYLNTGQAVAVDGSGNVVVMGTAPGDYYTAKYAATDGALLWERGYNSSANSYYYAQAMAVDGSGNVVVTGYSTDTNGFYDYYTAKYAAADGALLWQRHYNGPANSDDRANAVAVDGSGNVVVTGYIDGGWDYSDTSDYYTAKYAAADGALLWEKRYNGPANKRDQAQAVAVDANDNVVVTGISDAIFDCYDCDWQGDFYTAKYAAADGALLWEKRHNGPANGFDYAHAVAVDRSGNVVVTTGYSIGTNFNADYYTAKYAAADGALLWEKRYNGPANGEDKPTSLALGPNGMVAVTGISSGDYATVVYRDDVYPISIALVPGGVRLRFIGIPGRSYTIERAPAVTGPWTTLNTQTAPVSGLLEYLDAPPSPGSAFYRTVQP